MTNPTELDRMIEQGKAKIRKKTEAAFEGGIEEMLGETEIKRWIMERLESERQAMLRNLMGLESSFGEIRTKEGGLFDQVLRPVMREELTKIIDEDFPDIIRRVYTEQRKKLQAEFKRQMRESFQRKLEWELGRRADEYGRDLATKTINEMRGDMKL